MSLILISAKPLQERIVPIFNSGELFTFLSLHISYMNFIPQKRGIFYRSLPIVPIFSALTRGFRARVLLGMEPKLLEKALAKVLRWKINY